MILISLFAHKKGTGSSHNGRDSQAKRMGVKRSDGQEVLAASAAPSSIPATTSASARTTLCSLSSTASSSSRDWAKTKSRSVSIRHSNYDPPHLRGMFFRRGGAILRRPAACLPSEKAFFLRRIPKEGKGILPRCSSAVRKGVFCRVPKEGKGILPSRSSSVRKGVFSYRRRPKEGKGILPRRSSAVRKGVFLPPYRKRETVRSISGKGALFFPNLLAGREGAARQIFLSEKGKNKYLHFLAFFLFICIIKASDIDG